MITLFLQHLANNMEWKVPSFFFYSSAKMMLSFMTTLAFTLFLGPFFIRKLYQLKIGQKIRTKEECPLLYKLHEKKKDTPTMGGVLILFSIAISLFLWMDLTHPFTFLLFLTLLVLGTLGGVDDYLKLKKKRSLGLRPRKKMVVQTLFASFVALYLLLPGFDAQPTIKEKVNGRVVTIKKTEYMERLYVPFVKNPFKAFSGSGIIICFFMILFVIIGSSNAVNLTDGLDGLAAGLLILVGLVFALFAFLSSHLGLSSYLNIPYIEGAQEIAIFLAAMSGALLGFLWYNGHPAQVFMGDTGSLALGGVIGVCSVLLRREFLLGLVGGIFVIETLSVILQVLSYRYRQKKRIFLCTPLHHHFEYKGWPETKVVIRFWILGFLLALFGILSLKLQ